MLFVKLLLEMRDKYETTIVHAFVDDKTFKNTLNSVRHMLHRSRKALAIKLDLLHCTVSSTYSCTVLGGMVFLYSCTVSGGMVILYSRTVLGGTAAAVLLRVRCSIVSWLLPPSWCRRLRSS